MANPTPIPPPRHTRWHKGQSGNPGGAPALPPALKTIKSLTQLEVCKLVSKYGRMTREDVQAAAKDPKTPMVDMAIASIFVAAVTHGDPTRLAFLFDRALGKAPNVITDPDDVAELPLGDLIQLVKENLHLLEKDAG